LPILAVCGNMTSFGAIAQLGERLHGMQEVVGSNPIGSISITSCNSKVCEKSFLCHSPQQMLCYTYDYTFRNILEVSIMSRSRPASNPISYHKHTKQYYVTRGGKRIYLGSDKDNALKRYHQLNLDYEPVQKELALPVSITIKDLANRFITAQQANWRNPKTTLKCYKDWLGRFIKDHPRLKVADLTVEMFATWKISLKKRDYSSESINHFLSSVRAIFVFAEEAGLIEKAPKLSRIKNERSPKTGSKGKPLYTADDLHKLLGNADLKLRTMIMLALNCGFGPKDLQDLTWDDILGDRITLPRSKTDVWQTYLLWPETKKLLDEIRKQRAMLIIRTAKRKVYHSDYGHVFVTKFWRPWNKDAVAEQFRKLCKKAEVPCYGFYRLRHCASTAMSLVATPHVHRKFMRHSQLQQQVTYTHIPDAEVDKAVIKAKEKLFGKDQATLNEERNQEQEQVA
jgi:integrase